MRLEMNKKQQNRKATYAFTLDPDQIEALEKLAKAERLSKSAIVRRAIDAYIGKKPNLF